MAPELEAINEQLPRAHRDAAQLAVCIADLSDMPTSYDRHQRQVDAMAALWPLREAQAVDALRLVNIATTALLAGRLRAQARERIAARKSTHPERTAA